MNTPYNLLVICGLPRSGTTFLGQVVARDQRVTVIHEPLNKDFGVQDVPQWFPELQQSTSEGADAELLELIDDIIHAEATWTRTAPSEYSLATRLSKTIYGGSGGLAWAKLGFTKWLKRWPSHVCWKDPFATFLVEHLMQTYGARVVGLIRHPGALYVSQSRQYLPSYSDWTVSSGDAETHHLEQVAALWIKQAHYFSEMATRYENFLLLTHEDLCCSPLDQAERVCTHFDIELTTEMIEFIKHSTEGNKITATPGKLHSFRRNSRQLIDDWRTDISEEHAHQLRTLVGNNISPFYDQW